jgi:mono/diheme cytochrome c family protein
MYTGILHTHTFLIGIYVLFFLIKLYMLLANKHEQLARFRKKTRVIGEMVLPILFLASGLFLAINSPYASEAWFITKMIVIAATIVLGIFAFRAQSKALGIVTLFLFGYIIAISYTKTPELAKRPHELAEKAKAGDQFDPGSADYSSSAHGAYLFRKMACVDCHGEDGTKGLAGAANLQTSVLSDADIKGTIKNGRKNMAAYGSVLNEAEINALAAYIKTLRK